MTRSPEPGHFAVIFSTQHSGDTVDEYGTTAERMLELATDIDGFVAIDSVRAADGRGITVSYWESEAAIAEWKALTEHLEAQRRGRDEWYLAFDLTIAQVSRHSSYRARRSRDS